MIRFSIKIRNRVYIWYNRTNAESLYLQYNHIKLAHVSPCAKRVSLHDKTCVNVNVGLLTRFITNHVNLTQVKFSPVSVAHYQKAT